MDKSFVFKEYTATLLAAVARPLAQCLTVASAVNGKKREDSGSCFLGAGGADGFATALPGPSTRLWFAESPAFQNSPSRSPIVCFRRSASPVPHATVLSRSTSKARKPTLAPGKRQCCKLGRIAGGGTGSRLYGHPRVYSISVRGTYRSGGAQY